jgi:dUTPase
MSTTTFPTLQILIINENAALKTLYEKAIQEHNNAINMNPLPNAGFDLFIPTHIVNPTFDFGKVAWVGHNIRAIMVDENGKRIAYCLYPRSSMSKTPLNLANGVGVIDAGYTGEIIGAFRNVGEVGGYILDTRPNPRLVQICLPTLRSFYVELVDVLGDGAQTLRGNGGFGSTGV